jgi:hypothetical protein
MMIHNQKMMLLNIRLLILKRKKKSLRIKNNQIPIKDHLNSHHFSANSMILINFGDTN